MNNLSAMDNIPKNSWGESDVVRIIQWAIAVAGIVAVGFIVSAGVTYVMSQGNPDKTKKALRTILYAVAGLIVVIAAEAIIFFVSSNIG